MDRRLSEACWTGDVECLSELMNENPRILHEAALADGDTPMHIACMAGRLTFVKEMMKLRKEFARELNQHGLSSLHIASAYGHLEIVRELLQVDQNLCLLEGSERRIPLHYAAIKGRSEVISELLSVNSDSIESVTARGETALHLAVRNNQFNAFKVLVGHLKQFDKLDVINKQDDQGGNTILHLAASLKQYEVVDFLLNGDAVTNDRVEVNPLNKRNLTPLDVLSQSDGGDEGIEEILRNAGAKKAANSHFPPYLLSNQTAATAAAASRAAPSGRVWSDSSAPGNTLTHGGSRSPINVWIASGTSIIAPTRDGPQSSPSFRSGFGTPTRAPTSPATETRYSRWRDYLKFDEIEDRQSDVRNAILVVDILIATATYQAVLSPPGGLWQDNSEPIATNNNNNGSNVVVSQPQHKAGTAVMATRNEVWYGLFLAFNSVGFFLCLLLIIFLTSEFPMQLELVMAMAALSITYDICMVEISPRTTLMIFFNAISIAMPFIMVFATLAVRTLLKMMKKKSKKNGARPPTTPASGENLTETAFTGFATQN